MENLSETVPAHQTYQVVTMTEKGTPTLLAWAGSYEEAETKMKDLRANHVLGGSYRTWSGKKVGTGKFEIRRTLKANSVRFSQKELELISQN